jgi:hypothetical protein
MDTVAERTSPLSGFDLSKLKWIRGEDMSEPRFPMDLWTAVLGGDPATETIDFIVKWEAGSWCPFHRHLGDTTSIVLEGEHHVLEDVDGRTVEKIRKPGHYSRTPAGKAHNEFAGPEGSLVFFSARAVDGKLFENMDRDGKVLSVTTFTDMMSAL